MKLALQTAVYLLRQAKRRASTRASTWPLPVVLFIALAAATTGSSGAAAMAQRPAAAAAAAATATASTTTSTPYPSPPAPGQASRRLSEAATGTPVVGRTACRSRRHQSASASASPSAAAAAASNNAGRAFSGRASRDNREKKREVTFDRQQQQQRPSTGWWARARSRRTPGSSTTSRTPSSHADGRYCRSFTAAGFGFIASPATPAPGMLLQRQGRARMRGSSSSSSLAVGRLRLIGAQDEAGAWCAGGARTARVGKRQQPMPWGSGGGGGGGGGGAGGRNRGRRSSDAVVVSGGTGDTEYYSWTETDSDIEVRVSLPPGTKAKSVQLSVTKTAVTLGLKGREGPVLKGSLKGQVHADESHWTMEEMDDTGEKILYLCLEKAVDMEALAANNMPGDWEGVLEGEEPLNLYYPDKDKDFDVDEYVKRMGYDRERDIGKVDKTMFSDLTSEMKQNLGTSLPKSAFTDKDDMIPVMADPKVSPVIDTGVLGLPTPPPREPEVVTDVTVNVNADGTVEDGGSGGGAVDAEVMRDESWAAGFAPDLGGAAAGDDSDFGSGGGYSPAGFSADAEFDVPVKGPAGGAGELTARQREVSAGLRNTYEKLVKRGMINDTNPDGTPAKIPDMDEMARSYETEGFMFKDGDFTEEELSKYMDMGMGMGMDMDMDADLPDGELDLSDPEVRKAFGLE